MTVRAPRNAAQAAQLLERYAQLAGGLAHAEERRSRLIARANAAVDAVTSPLIAEAAAIVARLETWWKDGGSSLAGKRKSIELGGCMIGSRASAAKLVHGYASDEKAADALRGTRWGRQTTRVKYALDRNATLKLLEQKGKAAETIAELGFAVDQGGDQFFVKRAEQAGTVGA